MFLFINFIRIDCLLNRYHACYCAKKIDKKQINKKWFSTLKKYNLLRQMNKYLP